jgi:hypothetical protein
MVDASQIKEHIEIVGSDGIHVGTVDHMDGSDRIKLARKDPAAHGHHHYIPLDWVESVENDKVRLNKTSQEAEAQWQHDNAEKLSGGPM